jgi:hypothetical protein
MINHREQRDLDPLQPFISLSLGLEKKIRPHKKTGGVMKLKEWKKYHFSLLVNEVTRSIYREKSVVQLYYQLAKQVQTEM